MDAIRIIYRSLVRVAPFLIATVFILSFVGKSLSLGSFFKYSIGLTSLPLFLRETLPFWVLFGELACAALLLAPASRWLGLLLSMGLLTIFTVFLYFQAINGPDQACGCLGALVPADSILSQNWFALMRNVLLLTIGAGAVWHGSNQSELREVDAGRSDIPASEAVGAWE